MGLLNHHHDLGTSGSSSSSDGGVAAMAVTVNRSQPVSSGSGSGSGRDVGADFDQARMACLELQHACRKKGK